MLWINTLFHPTVKCRPLPISGALDVPMLHCIVVNVIEVPLKIIGVLQSMLPKSRLPDAAAALALSSRANAFFCPTEAPPFLRELLFDPTPARRIFGVAARKGPDRMQVLGQKDEGVDFKGPFQLAFTKNAPEEVPRRRLGEKFRTAIRHQGEEKRAAGNPGTSVIWHRVIIRTPGRSV